MTGSAIQATDCANFEDSLRKVTKLNVRQNHQSTYTTPEVKIIAFSFGDCHNRADISAVESLVLSSGKLIKYQKRSFH